MGEIVMMNRREALGRLTLGWAMAAGGPGLSLFSARTRAAENARPVLVVAFLRGGMDGLMAIAPHDDAGYVRARGDFGPESVLALDDRFGLHPALAPLLPLWQARELSIVHGVGLVEATRSHFDAQGRMEAGGSSAWTGGSGWLNRALAPMEAPSAFRRAAIGSSVPAILAGPRPVLATSDLRGLGAHAPSSWADGARMNALYERSSPGRIEELGREGLGAAEEIRRALGATRSSRRRRGGRPRAGVGGALSQVAELVGSDVGLELAYVEMGGWDTHAGQRPRFERLAGELATALSRFWSELGAARKRVCLVTLTEFGRTVRPNGSGGTDHGRASCSFVLGGGGGGRGAGAVRGEVGTLDEDALVDGRDLPVTTDFRALVATLLKDHMGILDMERVFPQWAGPSLDLWRG